VAAGWAGDVGISAGSEGRSLIQTRAVVHHSYDDVLNTPASASVPPPAAAAAVPARSPAASQRQSLTTYTRSVLFTSTVCTTKNNPLKNILYFSKGSMDLSQSVRI